MSKSNFPTTWNLTPLFKSDTDPNIETYKNKLKKFNYAFINKWQRRADYLTDSAILKLALDDYRKLIAMYGYTGNVGYYFELRTAQDQNDPKLKARYNQVEELGKQIQNDLQFFELNLAKISSDLQKKFLKDPRLSDYRHFIERLFNQSKHLLSEPEEKILNLKNSLAYENWVKMLEGLLYKQTRLILNNQGKKQNLTLSEMFGLVNHQKKAIRDSAASGINQILDQYKDIAEAEINSVLANKKIDDSLRHFDRPDASRHLSDDLDSQVVDTLAKTVTSHFKTAQRFYKLKAQLLKLPKLAYHERNVTFGKVDKSYSYDQAVELANQTLIKLDPEFSQQFKKFVEEGLIDVYPKPGKRGGAACWNHLISEPSYIILNFNNQLTDVLTIAHEFGHGLNNELIKTKQNALNFGTPTSTAEVASTFMEDFVLEELLKSADDELKLSLSMMKLNDDISAIHRQIACYNFETELHQQFRKKGYLSYSEIGLIFQKHMKAYMGTSVEQSKGAENWWIYWSHIRMFFYVYSYAGGLLISKSLQSSVRQDPTFILKVKQFLSAGMSDSPKNIFSDLGIDITKVEFWEKGLGEIDDLLNKTEKLARRLGKIK